MSHQDKMYLKEMPAGWVAPPYDAKITKDKGLGGVKMTVGSDGKQKEEERPVVRFRYMKAHTTWSANSDDAIDIFAGDEIKVYNWEDDYWWLGERADDRFCKKGLFPCHLVKPIQVLI